MNSARLLAVRSLVAITKNSRYANLELDAAIRKADLNDRDRALFTGLVYGVLEREITLDHFVGLFCKRRGRALSPFLRATLHTAFYQLHYMDHIPVRAVLFESAEIAKLSEKQSGANLVSAVLHSYLRAKADGVDLFSDLSGAERRSVESGIPQWMIELWDLSYGQTRSDEICRGFASAKPTCLHVNTLRTSPSTIIDALSSEQIQARVHPLDDALLLIDGTHGDLRKIKGFEEGHFFAQDYSSAAAVRALSPKPGERVADVCAAPGGKTFAAAIEMQNQGELFAFDLHEKRVSLIQKGAERLGLDCIHTAAHDARSPNEELIGAMDRVLCDVPCSGLGILGKKPDLRHKTTDEISRLPEVQREILSASARLVRNGGRLVYSTCTLNPAENEQVVTDFLAENANFSLLEEPRTLFPCDGDNDGFFYAVMEKTL